MTVDTRTLELTAPLSHPQLAAIPAFSDNYIWAFLAQGGNSCLVVDPGDADVVQRWLQRHGRRLTAILITHHHMDHTGGIQALRGAGVTVYGPRHEAIGGVDVLVEDGDRLQPAGIGCTFEVIAVPGHTAGHVAYHARPAASDGLLFCGDTLFSAGCGRLFEGSSEEMHGSLARLAALPPTTQVCCAHEYTLGNLRFAAAVEPDNEDIAIATAAARAWREAGIPTLPSSLARELRINPFLRTREPGVVMAAQRQGATSHEPVEVFRALRRWKDSFR